MWKGNKGDGSSRYQWVERDGEGRGEAMVKVVWRERMDGGGGERRLNYKINHTLYDPCGSVTEVQGMTIQHTAK